MLANAISRVGVTVSDGLAMSISPMLWFGTALWVGFMLYAEGYKGFQKQFCPRVLVRSMAIAQDPHPLRVAFAPAMAMGLFHATKKRKIVSWCLVIGITALVLTVRMVPQPYRALIDLGVIAGLGYGTLTLVVMFVRAMLGTVPDTDPELPTSEELTAVRA